MTVDLLPLSAAEIDAWADDPRGPVALHLSQALQPVEADSRVIFPATYADTPGGYCISTLADGTKVAQIDSVGAQANRMEPLFRRARPGQTANPLAALVPQVDITVGNGKTVSLLDAGHRLGDAIVRCADNGLAERARTAFETLLDAGDAAPLARLAPTSLVFGVWDSRDTQAKVPRILQAVIRAWDVTPLTRSAQYVPPVDYAALDVFSDEEKQKAEGNTKSPLAQRGYVHVPAVGTPGGVVAHGPIRRDVTLNLIALRALDGENGTALRRYVLGLALVAATEPPESFLRQGCLLTPDPQAAAPWLLVGRDGGRRPVGLDGAVALDYAKAAAAAFGVGPDVQAAFSKDRAHADVDPGDGKKKASGGRKAKA